MWAGIVAGLGAYAMGLLYLWELLPLNARFRWIAYLTATLAVIAVMSAYAGPIVVLETRSSILGVLRAILLRGIGLWNAAIITLIWFGSSLEALNRTLFGLLLPVISYSGLLLLLAGLLLAAAIRSDEKRRRRQRDALPARIRLTMTCPRCAAKQEFPIGAAKCAQCGFRMMIEIEEPRCECGYSLYQLRSDVCPECGRRVPAQQRWSRAPAPHH